MNKKLFIRFGIILSSAVFVAMFLFWMYLCVFQPSMFIFGPIIMMFLMLLLFASMVISLVLLSQIKKNSAECIVPLIINMATIFVFCTFYVFMQFFIYREL